VSLAKIAILFASLVSGALGFLVLRYAARNDTASGPEKITDA
jgi:Na+/H+ antiporter NhaA